MKWCRVNVQHHVSTILTRAQVKFHQKSNPIGLKTSKNKIQKKHVREHKHYCVKHKTPDLDANKQVGGNAKRRDIFT